MRSYAAAAGGLPWLAVLIAVFVVQMGSKAYLDAWAGNWAALVFGDRGLMFYLGIYALIGLVFAVATYAQQTHLILGLVRLLASHELLWAAPLLLP